MDVPEVENDLVAPNTTLHVHFLATNRSVDAPVVRRSPSADATLRTIHVEADIQDPSRTLPVGTTAEVNVDVGSPVAAASIPLFGASVRGDHATVFTVTDGIAKKLTVNVLGESGGSLFLQASLAGKPVVTQGRATLSDGDRVKAAEAEAMSASTPSERAP
jgi:hypothetical protein